jgi:hypothetical protein
LAASTFVVSACSAVWPKRFRTLGVVQRKVSKTMKSTWSAATKKVAMAASIGRG